MAERFRWGILGAAGIARAAVVPEIQRSRLGQVVAVASREVARAEAFARDLGVPRAAASYEALLSDPAIDGVYIPLPNALHAEWTIRAAAAGKPVLCEKPLATSAADAVRMVEACARHAVPLMEGFMYRFHPQTRRVQDLIASGAIGQVREVRAHLSVNILRTFEANNIRYAPALGGGALLDMGCYTVNIARMAFAAEPIAAFAQLRRDTALDVDVAAAGVLEFPDGLATIGCSFTADGQGRYSIVGSTGTIEVPRGIIPGLGTRHPQALIIIVDSDGNRREEILPPAEQYGLMADAFADTVRQGRPAPLSGQDAIANARVLDALSRSAATGRAEPV
jgi:xylose dehydrogenase (NAD/NADP)